MRKKKILHHKLQISATVDEKSKDILSDLCNDLFDTNYIWTVETTEKGNKLLTVQIILVHLLINVERVISNVFHIQPKRFQNVQS